MTPTRRTSIIVDCPDCFHRFEAHEALALDEQRCEHCNEIFLTGPTSKRRHCNRQCQLQALANRRTSLDTI